VNIRPKLAFTFFFAALAEVPGGFHISGKKVFRFAILEDIQRPFFVFISPSEAGLRPL
jgi:hypothetical protein